MKKFMALVLALVMVLGLATVGTNAAAYKDANDINYKEAVEVMSAVGVLKGDENGFRPADTLKRSEGAKIVAYLLLGNKTAESIVGTGNKFTDVPASHWACGYIEYLASIGVVGGVGNGKFDPDGQLTGVQFVKMLLVALGYDAELEELVGSDWSINTQKLANMNDLFAGMEKLVASDSIKREEAAQCCLNALKAEMVEYADKGTTVKIGESTVVTGASNAKKVEDNTKDYGVHDRYRQLTEFLYGNDLQLTAGEADDFGAPANKWVYKNEEVGTFSADSDIIYTKDGAAKKNALYDLIGKSAYDDIVTSLANNNPDLTGLDEETAEARIEAAFADDLLDVFVNGVPAAKTVANYFVKNNSADAANTGRGSTITIYKQDAANNAYKYTIVIKNVYAVQATDDYNKTSEAVNIQWVDTMNAPDGTLPSKIEQEDFDVSGVKEDDYLIVTFADGEIKSVAPATVVEGKVSTYKASSSVTVDGTKYEYNMKITDDGKGEEFDIDSKAKLILDTFGYIVCVDEADSADQFVYLQDLEKTKNNNATLYFTDGTSKTVTAKKIAGVGEYSAFVNTGEDNMENVWYTYSVDDAGRYTLKSLNLDDYSESTDAYFDESDTITTKNQVQFLTLSDVKANSSTVLLVLNNDEDVTVYTGVSNIPTLKVKADEEGLAKVAYFTEKDKDFAKYVFVDASAVKTSADDSSSASNYMFILKSMSSRIAVAGDKAYAENDILLDGELVKAAKFNYDVVEDETYATGYLYKNVKTNSDGYYTTPGEFDEDKEFWGEDHCYNGIGAINYSNSVLTMDGHDYVLNGNVTLIYKKGFAAMNDKNSDYEINTVSGSSLASALKTYNYQYRYFGVLESDNSNKVKTLYVYVESIAPMLTFVFPAGEGAPTIVDSTNALLVNGTNNKYFYFDENEDDENTDATFVFSANIAVETETEGATTLDAGTDPGEYSYNEGTKTLTINKGFAADGQITVVLDAGD